MKLSTLYHEKPKTDHISELPTEILSQILSSLLAHQAFKLRRVSRSFNTLLLTKHFATHLLCHHWYPHKKGCREATLLLLEASYDCFDFLFFAGHMINYTNFQETYASWFEKGFLSIALQFREDSSNPKLRLSNCTLPPQIASFKHLRTLQISNHNIIGEIPTWIGELTNLSSLSFSRNSLSGSIPPAISALIRLTSLDLSGNHLTGPIPLEIVSSLTSLIYLNLSSNLLVGPIPECLGFCLRHLQDLILADNELTGGLPDSLSKLENLTVLNLSCNQISGSIPFSFGQLYELEVFNLYGNRIERDNVFAVIGGMLARGCRVTLY
ncbi:hypothetical protein BDR26DRAFT_877356 [Obelidium mucronatum]|nr:hypothetical protein BDR26DRAFT_877356 [Obelidium mucronatum]